MKIGIVFLLTIVSVVTFAQTTKKNLHIISHFSSPIQILRLIELPTKIEMLNCIKRRTRISCYSSEQTITSKHLNFLENLTQSLPPLTMKP